MNKVILIGNVGKDPAVKNFENGKIVNLSLATTERGYTTKDGKKVPEQVEWHNLMFAGNFANVAEKYIKKGDKLYVEGRIRTRSYKGTDGIDHQIKEIIVSEVELLTAKPKVENTPQKPAITYDAVNNSIQPVNDIENSDLPF